MAGLGTRDSGLGLRCDTMMPIVKAIDFPRFEDDVGDFRRLMNCEIFSGTAVISLAVGSLDLWGTELQIGGIGSRTWIWKSSSSGMSRD